MDIVRSALFVEWDDENHDVVAIVRVDGEKRSTGVESSGTTSIRPLDVAYPDGYTDQFSSLLGHATFEEQPYSDAILQTFPQANVTPEAVYRLVLHGLKARAHQILAETDWYFTRFLEAGNRVPPEIRNLRARTREAATLDEDDLLHRAPSEYIEFTPIRLEAIARETDVLLGRVPEEHFEGDHP